MKKLFFILLLLLPFASAEGLYDFQSLELEQTILNSMKINPTSDNYYITDAEIHLLWFPRDDYRQEVLEISTSPSVELEEDGFLFLFDRPQETELDVRVDALIKTTSYYKRVYDKIEFPLDDLDSELAQYLSEQEIIDINDDISDLANELSAGKDDLYEVVFAFADWVEENIEYDLTTLTSEAAQKSSWVMDNRYGVCDELTALFISLNRAVGIPAKFISGISYTNVESFDDPWGPHGWAEVYFPNVGWVPFDVTYNQFGWVDATHIKLRESADSSVSSVSYNAKGKYFTIQGGALDTHIEVVNEGSIRSALVSIDLAIQKSKVGFGSYNILVAEIKNNKNYYVTVDLNLAPTQNIENLDDRKRSILLKPGESKKEYFIIKVQDDLRSGYSYTFPLKITGNMAFSEVEFESDKTSIQYDYNYFKSQVPEEEEIYSPIDIDCKAEKTAIYVGEMLNVNCVYKNKESKTLRKVDVCFEDDCHQRDFSANEEYQQDFMIDMPSVGVKNLAAKAFNNYFSATSYVLIHSIDSPIVEISNIKFPEEVSFHDTITVSFSVSQESFSNPTDIKILFEGKRFSEKWDLKDLKVRNDFKVSIPANILSPRANEFKISASYKDDMEKDYDIEEIISINLSQVTFSQKIIIWLNQLSMIIENFISNI